MRVLNDKLTLLDLTCADPGSMADVSPEQFGILLVIQTTTRALTSIFFRSACRPATTLEMIEGPWRPESRSRSIGRRNLIVAWSGGSLLGACKLNGSRVDEFATDVSIITSVPVAGFARCRK